MIVDWVGDDPWAKQSLLEHVLGRCHEVHNWAGTLTEGDISTLTETGFKRRVPIGIRDRYSQRMLVRPVTIAETDSDWVLDGLRLDQFESWSLHALSSDIY